MNSDNLPQLLKTGFHLTLGAASFAIETLQSPIEREKNLAKLQSDLGLLADELLEKGETIDREARNYVDSVFGEQFGEQREKEQANDSEFASDIQSDRTSEQQSDKPADKSPEPFTGSDVRLEIQELTAQMAALRVELESLRAENSEQG
jgi:polyhydroxyalkanoate synthesis regulator phasin